MFSIVLVPRAQERRDEGGGVFEVSIYRDTRRHQDHVVLLTVYWRQVEILRLELSDDRDAPER